MQLQHHELPLYICECYFPHSKNIQGHKEAWEEIQNEANKLANEGHILIMGDFNAHTGLNGDHSPIDHAGRILLHNIDLLQLHLLNSLPICEGNITRSVFHKTDASLHNTTIDYMAISESLRPYVAKFEISTDSLGSDHYPLILTLKGLKSLKLEQSKSHEAWRIENIPKAPDPSFVQPFFTAFETWVASTTERMKEDIEDHTQAANLFEWSFQNCLEEVAFDLIGKKWVKPKSFLCMSTSTRILNQTRLKLAKRARHITDNPNYFDIETRRRSIEAYTQAKKSLLIAEQKRKQAFELAQFKAISMGQTCSKTFWSRIKRLRTTFKNSKSPPPMVQREDGSIATSPLEVLQIWKRYTESNAQDSPSDRTKYDTNFYNETNNRLHTRRQLRIHQPDLDHPIDRTEVWRAVRALKMGKAAGVDSIVSDILRTAAGAVWNSKLQKYNPTIDAITLLFNYVYDKEVWPERWSSGIIIPLHKQDSPTDPSNYRPITLLSIMQKLFGYVLNQRLLAWAEDHETFSDAQGGFRWNRSTVDQILILLEILTNRKQNNQATLITFIDIRKAYDKVWRQANYNRIFDKGIKGKAWRQLQTMHDNLKSFIRLPTGDTDPIDFQLGVAQGAVESPWTFNCFINGLAEELAKHDLGILLHGRRVALLMYADDIAMFAASIPEMQHMNQIVTQYAQKFRFQFNGAKSGVMVFNAPRNVKERVTTTKWTLFGEAVPVKHSYKYLGVEITTKINNWRPYFSKAIQKAQHATNLLLYICRHDKGLLPRAARSYWQAKVRPVLEYAAEIWAGDLPQDLVAKAEKIQTDFARRILGLHKADGISNQAILAELGLEPLRSRWYKLRLGYWRRIFTYNPSRLVREVISTHREQTVADPQSPGWCASTKRLLETHYLHEAWDRPLSCAGQTKQQWKEKVYNAVDALANSEREGTMSQLSSLTQYVQIKDWRPTPRDRCFSMSEQEKLGMLRTEQYLDDLHEHIGRKLKTLCRLNTLPLMDKVGKQQQWSRRGKKRWNCPLCKETEDNLTHYFFECPSTQKWRDKLLDRVIAALQEAQIPHLHRLVRSQYNFHAETEYKRCPHIEDEPPLLTPSGFYDLPTSDKLLVLLGKNIGCQTAEKHIDTHVKRFLRKTWKLRRPYVEATNTKYGRHDYLVDP